MLIKGSLNFLKDNYYCTIFFEKNIVKYTTHNDILSFWQRMSFLFHAKLFKFGFKSVGCSGFLIANFLKWTLFEC